MNNTSAYTRWNLPEGAVARLGKGWISDIVYSTDGELLAVCAGPGIWLYDGKTFAETALLNVHGERPIAAAFAPNGKTIAAAYHRSETARIWNVQTGGIQTEFEVGRRAYSVAYSPNGRTIAVGMESAVMLADTRFGKPFAELKRGKDYSAVALAFSPNSRMLASNGGDGAIHLWDAETGDLLKKIDSESDDVYCLAFSPDGKTLASGEDDETVRLWDVQTGQLKVDMEGPSDSVTSIAYSPDGRYIVSSRYGNQAAHIWNVHTGQLRRQLNGHGHAIGSAVYSPDGRMIVTGGSRYGGTLRVWDAHMFSEKRVIEEHTATVDALAYSPDGKLIASGHWDDAIRLWDVQSRSLQKTLLGHKRDLERAAFSPDGKTLASASYDQTARLWDVQTGRQKAVLKDMTGSLTTSRFPQAERRSPPPALIIPLDYGMSKRGGIKKRSKDMTAPCPAPSICRTDKRSSPRPARASFFGMSLAAPKLRR
ncbi:MAG: WD40 repeat domain-containing protein [Candidatus Poribacteria bacterium]|nr:WD40 repeat domain-containing protein [Candidatus Poribacteria bacterium]